MPAYSRNLESQGLTIQRWITGLVTQRSPLYTPISALGLQFVARQDALIDGLNMEISPVMTLIRRPAYSRFSSVAFGAGDYPLNYYSFQNTSGTIYPLVDTPNKVYNFSATINTAVLTKSAGAGRGDFFRVGDYVYYCNGVDLLFWNGTTWSNWGIVAPATAPTITLTAGSLSPTAGYTYVICYVNTVTGHVSAASPASTNTGPQTNQNFVVHYTASTDAQVNAIWIFRTQDGGGIYYFLASVANATSTYTDSLADGSLNTFIVAPLAPGNAPAPAGSSLVTFWDGRLWVAAKNILYWSQGPQTVTGVGEQSFNLSTNFFKLPINIKGFAPTTNGLLVFTSDVTWIVTGSGGIYFINPWQKNFGIKTPNAVTQDGDLVFVVTSRGQCFEIGSNLTEIGLNIRAKIAAMNPNNVSITIHRNGADEGVFLSDGSANVYRYSLTFGCWSPPGQPVQGAGVIGSIETSDANWTLLLGSTVGGKFIGGRNLSSWTDDGGTYTCYGTVGSLIIGPAGSKNNIEAVCIKATKIQTGNTYPTVSVMLNEINTTNGQGFSVLPNPVDEPPALAGTAYASQTVFSKRHNLKSGNTTTGLPIPQQVEHMQIKVAFVAENNPDELLVLSII
jgi:hypothetical protein